MFKISNSPNPVTLQLATLKNNPHSPRYLGLQGLGLHVFRCLELLFGQL